jgi:hypothetical protein
MSYIISSRPFYDPQKNFIDVMNEFFYYLALAFSFLFTDISSDTQSKSSIGYIFNSLILMLLIINFIY